MVFLIVVWNFSRSRRELGRGGEGGIDVHGALQRWRTAETTKRFYADHLQGGHPGKLGGQTTLISGICSRAGNSLPTCTACLGFSAVMRKRPRVHDFNADVTTDKCRRAHSALFAKCDQRFAARPKCAALNLRYIRSTVQFPAAHLNSLLSPHPRRRHPKNK